MGLEPGVQEDKTKPMENEKWINDGQKTGDFDLRAPPEQGEALTSVEVVTFGVQYEDHVISVTSLSLDQIICTQQDTVEVGSLHTLRMESSKLIFQPLPKFLVNKLLFWEVIQDLYFVHDTAWKIPENYVMALKASDRLTKSGSSLGAISNA